MTVRVVDDHYAVAIALAEAAGCDIGRVSAVTFRHRVEEIATLEVELFDPRPHMGEFRSSLARYQMVPVRERWLSRLWGWLKS